MIWCRKQLNNGEYHYVCVPKRMAYHLYMFQGYEINVDPPEHEKNKWGQR